MGLPGLARLYSDLAQFYAVRTEQADRPGERAPTMLAQVAEEPTSSDSKVRVLLEFMGQLVSAEVPWSDLHIAPEDSRGDSNHGGRRRTRGRGRWIRNRGSEAIALT